jgi:DNA-binding response OmpR family regulator
MSAIADAIKPTQPTQSRPRVLVVEDEPTLRELLQDAFGRSLECQLHFAANIAEARRILSTQPIELLVTDISLPDGDGTDLLEAVRKHQPLAESIVITGKASMDGAINAFRHGAADFLPKPFTVDHLLARVRRVLYRQSIIAKNEARIDKLKEAVKKLNEARRLVSKKVDLLCNDLISAYGELAKQLDEVRTQESFRTLLTSANDLEQMLCHAMDWLLRQLGYSNIAIWLAGDDEFQLGAYMKYTIPGDAGLVDAMRAGIIRRVIRDGFLHLEGADARKQLTSVEAKLLPGQTIVATHCTYLGESLAALVMFREADKPFSNDDIAVLKAISPIFAVTLASIVRGEKEDDDDEDGGYAGDIDAEADENFDDLSDSSDRKSRRPRRRSKGSEADWWKHGGPPPF